MNLNGPPYPYTEKDWSQWYPFVSKAGRGCATELQAIHDSLQLLQGSDGDESEVVSRQKRWVSQSMLPWTIRELPGLKSDNEADRFIGAITIERGTFLYILDEDERRRRKQENNALDAGDRNIIWEVGFYLVPKYHGRGIMPAVLRTLIKHILVPYMNVHTLMATYFEYNTPSRRVFEKCGFEFLQLLPDAITLPPTKNNGITGRKVGLGVMRWQLA
ncbi:hypothetical protein LTS07_008947 [Exophiala sideris]|uniref:N-acetyltransferase domain-containing protein n=1 Tax=Exophiala sideris TaxID=1016849 RepID=A0ABR0J0W0_9EURO|nr:hypothetical protein LTS07_008947 [Exophiala sideris]KAK5030159.1 hypothetical protein LTR13_008472 [Exophiala sideris]KAK5053654.1 hypothetical protein LTR69_009299 [Exophiala sideris]KAK5179303.1 hypothetical protein LTR44_008141 [Eurotiomycetes sp. CCFEE 6388]